MLYHFPQKPPAKIAKRHTGLSPPAPYLGKNKEAFDAEVFAILRAVRLLDERGESGREYTIFSDAQAAVARVQHDRCGPSQALAKAVVATVDDLYDRDNTLAIGWTPSHEGVQGHEQAGGAARLAAEGRGERAGPDYLGEASLSHLMRKDHGGASEVAGAWIRGHVGRRHRYCSGPVADPGHPRMAWYP